MINPLTALTNAAVATWAAGIPASGAGLDLSQYAFASDPVIAEAIRRSFLLGPGPPEVREAVAAILSDPALEPMRPIEGELDPFVMSTAGGIRLSPDTVVSGLMSAAIMQMFLLRLPEEEGTFVRLVLEGFEELKRAARGEDVRGYAIAGFAHVTLPEDSKITTPWGVLRPAPTVNEPPFVGGVFRPATTVILAWPRLLRVVVDRSAEPTPPDFDPADAAALERGLELLPLACALASDDAQPAAPVRTWATTLLPFTQGVAYTQPGIVRPSRPPADLQEKIAEIEEWARLIEASHSQSIDVAARRAVSAIAQRTDRSDTLVDAVMVWENLVGTRTELTYRVTAALSKLLETNPANRPSLRKDLNAVYETRSRVVHGDFVEPKAVDEAAHSAIRVALATLRASYRRGASWLTLTSTQRADQLLLQEP